MEDALALERIGDLLQSNNKWDFDLCLKIADVLEETGVKIVNATTTCKFQFHLQGDRVVTFEPGGRKRVTSEPGFCLVNADLMAADGTRFDAVMQICEIDSGENYGAFILLPGGIFSQSQTDFLERLGKTADEFYPYRYHIRGKLRCQDFHTGPDGWS